MTRFNDFLANPEVPENIDDFQKVSGNYGCQACEKYASIAYFDEKKGELMWFCDDDHKSSFTVS